jgi:hypothetical protein
MGIDIHEQGMTGGRNEPAEKINARPARISVNPAAVQAGLSHQGRLTSTHGVQVIFKGMITKLRPSLHTTISPIMLNNHTTSSAG